jgi:hypothetical protein
LVWPLPSLDNYHKLALLWESFQVGQYLYLSSIFISMESVGFHEADDDYDGYDDIQKLQAIDLLAKDSIPILPRLFIRKIISA